MIHRFLTITVTAILCSALVFVSGCGGPEKDLVGTWNGQIVQPNAQEQSTGGDESDYRQMSNSLADETMVLELNSDMTCKLISNQGDLNGEWELSEDGKTITINPIVEFESVGAEKMSFLVGTGGTTLTMDLPEGAGQSIVFKK